MKKLSVKGTRWLKIIHLVFAGMWIGGALSMLVVMLFGTYDSSGGAMEASSVALKRIDDFVVIPGAIGLLLTGLVYSVWTNWGFVKFRWIITKWILTVAMVLFGTFVMGPRVNDNVFSMEQLHLYVVDNAQYFANVSNNKIFASIQLAAMLFIFAISVLKPWGRRAKKGAKKS